MYIIDSVVLCMCAFITIVKSLAYYGHSKGLHPIVSPFYLDDFLLAQLEHLSTIFQSENEIFWGARNNFQILFMENTRVLFFCITRMCNF